MCGDARRDTTAFFFLSLTLRVIPVGIALIVAGMLVLNVFSGASVR